ncbi:MAG TPA: AAA family ATPase [Terriglobales bacterium]|jgi:chromosome segregation protein|nr:AAA family ATPase [Terriglobales bacterium]
MRIRKISLTGYRGARGVVEIPCGPAFTVICGRNGTGKSSICDALEFVLTGTLDRYREETERGEKISDYLWWRGRPAVPNHSVVLELEEADGSVFTLGRAQSSDVTPEQIDRLCFRNLAPSDWVIQLCLTTIIRDETIARLSTDQPERERYEFVLQAIGLANSVAVEKNTSEIAKYLTGIETDARAAYDQRRHGVEALTFDLSRARISAMKASEESIARLREIYRQQLEGPVADLSDLTKTIAQRIAQQRTRIEILGKLRERKDALDRQLQRLNSPDYQEHVRSLEAQREALQKSLDATRERRDAIKKARAEQETGAPALTSLALLREHGGKLGLRKGKCPLCGSELSPQGFEAHLKALDDTVHRGSETLAGLIREDSQIDREYELSRLELNKVDAALSEARSLGETLEKQLNGLEKEAEKVGTSLDAELLSGEISKCGETVASLNEDLMVVEAYAAIHRVTELTELLRGAQQSAESAEKQLSTILRAQTTTQVVADAAKRVSNEIVRERLAFLKPLFLELCDRIRPHSEWPDIDFLLRGDVRPFLSFMIGEDMNPRFVFSSGQRRALGLAFLLAVHLSRGWCKLETLILDDPIQHVDDYRALHLVETLAGLRMLGRQIICTVEDPALADLLCRRLRSNSNEPGIRIDLGYEPGEGVRVENRRTIPEFRSAFVAAD